MTIDNSYIKPNWPAPSNIKAFCTTRFGGYSQPPFDEFNLALHVEDKEEDVLANRAKLKEDLNLPSDPVWLNQIHSTKIATLLDKQPEALLSVDATTTSKKGIVCTVMTGDCLPILLCDKNGTQVAAIHAGWRGLAGGIIFETIKAMRENNELLAWLGPAIGPSVYEVDLKVKEALSEHLSPKDAEEAMKPLSSKPGHYLANLYAVARQHLSLCGVQSISGGEYCTYTQSDQFFSYRKFQGKTGRIACLIWMC